MNIRGFEEYKSCIYIQAREVIDQYTCIAFNSRVQLVCLGACQLVGPASLPLYSCRPILAVTQTVS
jgi:hypothetical protein